MRIAVIADIHGNIQALECVLDDLRRWAPDITVAVGDLIFKYADSLGVLETLRSIDHIAIRGNADERVFQTPEAPPLENEHPIWKLARYTRKAIGPDWCDYLMNLPDHIFLSVRGTNDVCIAHGVPGDSNRTVVWSEEREEQLGQRPDGAWPSRLLKPHSLKAVLNEMGSALFVTAHVHRQFHRHIYKTDVVNPGAVTGHHIYREGAPLAEYMICELEPKLNVWTFIFRQLPYDHQGAVRAVRELERECPRGAAWALDQIVGEK